MDIADLIIIFSKCETAYIPGQMFPGRVEFFLSNPKTVKMITMKFKGEARVEWAEIKNETSNGGSSTTKIVTYDSNEDYFEYKVILNQCSNTNETVTLPPGKHSYPFVVKLPKNIPSSYSCTTGNIYYYAEVRIIIPNQPDKIKKQFFLVKNLLDLNDYPKLKVPVTTEKYKKFFKARIISCGKLCLRTKLPKSAYVPGEIIPILVEINNASDVTINEINVYLIRKLENMAKNKMKDVWTCLVSHKVDSEIIRCHSSKNWIENFTIPRENFPYLENCHIMIMKHLLKIEIQTEGIRSEMDVCVPITIGDIPYDQHEII